MSSNSSDDERGERGRGGGRRDLQNKARKLKNASPSYSYQTIKSMKSDLHNLKKQTPQRQKRDNTVPPTAPSPIRSPAPELPLTAGVPPLPEVKLPSPPYRPGRTFPVRKR